MELIDNHPVLAKEYDQEIRPLIDIIDKLRKFGIEHDINLPTVIVVGDQSSGKSSIIEAISGVELPRGPGIVTRCPLELQLVKANPNEQWKATLTCQREKREIYNPCDVGPLVEAGQRYNCGPDKDISEELLTLRIESPDAPDLTLIDLPGITRTPLRGQSSDVCTKIKNIIQNYVKNKNAVILCVISSNLDLAVNEALSVANHYDPKKERTIGVLTKPDKADSYQKEDIIKLLRNEKFELKKGYVVVKCRSQEDLDNNLPLVKSQENENQFFQKDDYFCQIHPSQSGIPNLAKKITEELKCIIKKTFPTLISELKTELEKCLSNLKKLPPSIPTEDGAKRIHLNKIINETLIKMSCLLKNGQMPDFNVYNDWRNYFNDFHAAITNIQTECLINTLSETELAQSIENSRGKEFRGFYNYELFEKLVSEHVIKYVPSANNLLEMINNSTKYYLFKIVDDHFHYLTKIKQELKEIAANALNEAINNAKCNIDIIFAGEKIIFTMDNELMKTFNPQLQHSQFSSKQGSAQFIHQILKSYLKIVQSRLCDTLPIAIRLWVHIKLYDVLEEQYMKYANDIATIPKIEECSNIEQYRENLVNKYYRLFEAEKEIEQFSNNFPL